MADYRNYVYFLPWLDLRREISIGPTTFWSYSGFADQRINDPNVRDYLDKLFRCFVDHQGNSVSTITVCSAQGADFRILTEAEHTSLVWAVDALAFASIVEPTKRSVVSDIRHNPPPSANMFELRYQGFSPGSDLMAYRVGSVSHLGVRMGAFSFSEPWTTGGVFVLPTQRLLEGLGNCFKANISDEVRLRIFRSLQWFKLAHTEEQLGHTRIESYLPRVVMMGTAFEILLNFPGGRSPKTEYFVDYIERHLAHPNSVRSSRTINKRKGARDLCLAACWACDFYWLRNKVVHGSKVSPDELVYKTGHWVTHLIVADLVFEECLKRILFDNRLVGERARWFTQELGGSPEDWAFLERFNRYHASLGWNQSSEDQSE